jgi:uncharacterized protein YprB with RNaseH-like and TPR domain
MQSIQKAGKVENKIENLKKLVFLDTETTGLAGGTGTLVFLIGMARFDDQGLKLTQYLVEDPSQESAMLLALSNYGADVEAVVTFNGKSFDMPLLKTRYLLNKLPIPFSNWGHLDLLHLSRRIWKMRLPSRSLKDLEQEILHIPRSDEEVPGWMIPEIYFDYLRTGDATQIANVVYHNAMDIVSLAALYLMITRMLDQDLFSGQIHDLDVFSIGQLYESIGEIDKAAKIYEHCYLTNRMSEQNKLELSSKLALLYKKQFQWDKALPHLLSNGKSGDIDSCIELAKFFEHVSKEEKKALEWTIQAEIYLASSNLNRYQKKTVQNQLLTRKIRLEKRINHVSQKDT